MSQKTTKMYPPPENVVYEVVSAHDDDVAFPVPTALQVWITEAEVEPGTVDVDACVVVNVLWAVLTTSVVRVGISTQVWAMLETEILSPLEVSKGKSKARYQVLSRTRSLAGGGG